MSSWMNRCCCVAIALTVQKGRSREMGHRRLMLGSGRSCEVGDRADC
ncbi:MAG: hypothetical protein WBA57_06120 [Elainellaceae cyanobacterium]